MNNQNLLLLKLLCLDFRDNWPLWKTKLQRSLSKWLNAVAGELGRILLLGLCAWGGYVVFLYYLHSLWEIFASTPMGNIFATRVSPGIGEYLSMTLDLDIVSLACDSVFMSLIFTVLIGICLKFTGVSRLTYSNRGFVG